MFLWQLWHALIGQRINNHFTYIVLCFASLILWSLEKIDKEAAAVWNKLLKKANNKWCENTKAACVVYYSFILKPIVVSLSFVQAGGGGDNTQLSWLDRFQLLSTTNTSHTYLTKTTVFGEDMHPNRKSLAAVKWWAFKIPLSTLHWNF